MAVLRRLDWASLDAASRRRLVDRRAGSAVFDPGLRRSVREVMDDVRANGDEAVSRALARFDGCDIRPDRLLVDRDEMLRARRSLDPVLLDAIRAAHTRIRRFSELVLARSVAWEAELEPGLLVGEIATPIASAGLYVPCGKGSFPSTMLMLGTPAVAAGVPEVVAIVPPVPGTGDVDPAVLAAALEAGVERVYRANGVAGVAAVAYGTESVPQVVKLLGPGSPAVAAAQVEAQADGCVTFMVFGPSEAVVVADASADPDLLAADLLIEAEHGDDSAVFLVTADGSLVDAVDRALDARLATLPEPRRAYAAASLGPNGGAVQVRSLDEALDVANAIAPEHLQLAVADPDAALDHVVHAGEVLVGQSTPFSAANYVLGVPHALPTSGYARVSSGVSAHAFLKVISTARTTPDALVRVAPDAIALAEHEGFPAHAAALRARLPR